MFKIGHDILDFFIFFLHECMEMVKCSITKLEEKKMKAYFSTIKIWFALWHYFHDIPLKGHYGITEKKKKMHYLNCKLLIWRCWIPVMRITIENEKNDINSVKNPNALPWESGKKLSWGFFIACIYEVIFPNNQKKYWFLFFVHFLLRFSLF